jgi:hypothetical protein
MHPMRHGRTILSTAILAAAVAIPVSTSAQTPFRAACDLLSDQAVSDALGFDVTSSRTGSQGLCFYSGDAGGPVNIWLNPDATLSMFSSQDGVEPVTVGGLEGLSWPSQSRLILALPEGGLLDLTVYGSADVQATATALAEAILASGPVTAIPADKGPAESLYLDGPMCDLLSPDEVNAITGGSYGLLDGPAVAGDQTCTYQADSEFVVFGLGDDYGRSVDTGTYGSEDVQVDGRPATWAPDTETLTVDAGDGIILTVAFSAFEPEPKGRRDEAVGIAEAVIPQLSTDAPATPTTAECAASLDELSRISGLEIVNPLPFGPLCYYSTSSTSAQEGVLIGILPGEDPAAALEAASFSSEIAPTATDVDGHAALAVDAPEGASLAVDLDGLPGGDGQVLVVATGGLPEGTDAMAVATELVRYVISMM